MKKAKTDHLVRPLKEVYRTRWMSIGRARFPITHRCFRFPPAKQDILTLRPRSIFSTIG
ncbi:unnamed protein product, partial [Nippostrongylus brasiliensis]|uniref:Uncharacterized protein n=1 Tax=Nippostrongylus brasiliensis TaxID=27835 RepID=A0A0N4XR11_NIPBR